MSLVSAAKERHVRVRVRLGVKLASAAKIAACVVVGVCVFSWYACTDLCRIASGAIILS